MNYQNVMLAGTIVQDILLLASAILIGLYLYETYRMRVAAEAQLEAQIRPAVAVRVRNAPESLLLVNVGKGPALNLTLSPAERGSEGSRECAERETFDVALTFIAEGGEGVSGIRTQAHPGLAGVPVLNVEACSVSTRASQVGLTGLLWISTTQLEIQSRAHASTSPR